MVSLWWILVSMALDFPLARAPLCHKAFGSGMEWDCTLY